MAEFVEFKKDVIERLHEIERTGGNGEPAGIIFEVIRYNDGEPKLNIQTYYTKDGEQRPGKRQALDREVLLHIHKENLISRALEVIGDWHANKGKKKSKTKASK